jgi:hypothetical protein
MFSTYLKRTNLKGLWKTGLHRDPWGCLIKTLNPCPWKQLTRVTDVSKNPLAFLSLHPSSLLTGTVATEREKGGTAYRRRESSGGGLSEVWEVLAITSRGGSPALMAGIGMAACVGGRARRRRVLRPAHGGRVQLNSTESFPGGQGCRRRKESTNGLPCSSVYMRRRPIEVRRCQSGVSGGVVFALRARGASLSSEEVGQGVRREEEGWGGRSTVAGARVAAGTPCVGKTPVNLRSDGVGSVRGRTVEAWDGFIATGICVHVGRRGPARLRPTKARPAKARPTKHISNYGSCHASTCAQSSAHGTVHN